MLYLFKTRCVFINRNSVFADWTKWKGADSNESMMLKMFYLFGFVRWTKYTWWAKESNYLLVYKLFEFACWMNSCNQKSFTVHGNSRTLKFDNFPEFQNILSDSPLPHPRASVWHIAYENRYMTHPLIEFFGNATTFQHLETSINVIETLKFSRQFEIQG